MQPTTLFYRYSIFFATLCCFCLTGPSDAQENELLTEAPTHMRIFGTINDESGKSIEKAELALVTIPYGFLAVKYFDGSAVVERFAGDMEGKFDLMLPFSDSRFRPIYAGTDRLLLIIQAKGHQSKVIPFPLARTIVDFPFDIKLRSDQPIAIHVRDSSGQPLADAVVKPAKMGEHQLPLNLELGKTHKTSAEGIVTLNGFNTTNLDQVYIVSTKGNQQVPIQIRDGKTVASLTEMGTVKGRFELPDDVDLASVAGKKLLVLNFTPVASESPSLYSWQFVQLDEHASFEADRMGDGQSTIVVLGDPNEFPFETSRNDRVARDPLSQDNPTQEMNLKYYHARHIPLTFVDDNNIPLPGISVSNFRSTNWISDANGVVNIPFPHLEKASGQILAFDSLDVYQITSNFGVILDRAKQTNGVFEPFALSRSRSLKGEVVDAQGSPLSGAKIQFSYQIGSDTQQMATIADQSGRFEIRGLPPQAGVTISGSLHSLGCDEEKILSATAGDPTELVLRLTPQRVALPSGRVIDDSGNLIVGARVVVSRGEVVETEGFSAGQLLFKPIETEEAIFTADDGSFRYPTVGNFQVPLQVSIEAAGFRKRVAPFIDGARIEVAESLLPLGDFKLVPTPASQSVVVRVIDAVSNEPIPETELVFISCDSGRQLVTTSKDGTVDTNLFATKQLVAARAEGHKILYQFLENVSDELTLKLKPVGDSAAENLAWFKRPINEYRKAGQRLLDQLEVPGANDSTYYRQNLYFAAQLAADFPAFKKIMLPVDSPYEYRTNFLMMNSPVFWRKAPEESLSLLAASSTPAEQKVTLLAAFGLLSETDEEKDEIYGESILALGETTGVEMQIVAGSLTVCLILDGRIETAKQIVADVWDSADELKKLLEKKEIKPMIGESRMFLPVLGIIEPESAIELIRLTASENEINRITNKCLTLISLTDPTKIDEICTKYQLTFDASGIGDYLDQLDASSSRIKYTFLTDWCLKNVARMADSSTKVEAAMFVVRNLPAGTERDDMFALAATTRPGCVVRFHWDDPAKEVLEELAKFDSLSARELDILLFTYLQNLPASFPTTPLAGVFANAVKLVAIRDAGLARKLLEPAFENGDWLLGIPTWSPLEENYFLKSAAWVDPVWACELAESLSARYSPDEPRRKLELFAAVIKELGDIASRRER